MERVLPHMLASAVVLDAAGRHVLLVRDAERMRWRLPTGHVEGGEQLAEAARRQVREQTQLVRFALVEPHLAVQQDRYVCRDVDALHVDHVFLAVADALTDVDASPGGAATWFPVDTLPADRDAAVRLHMAQARRAAAAL